MQQPWDSDVKSFFKKILNTIGWGLLWLMAAVTAGLFFELAYTNGKPLAYTIIYYIVLVFTLGLLIRYLYRTWKD